jgi:putative membrane protein
MAEGVPAELRARFDPRLRTWLVLYVASILVSTVAGVLVLPLWLIVGPFWASRYFQTIEARLSGRGLVYRHGVWFRREMNIPLDKIQDLSLQHGPVLDALGLSVLRVETAGGSEGGGGARLIGVIDAEAFRAEVLARRDAVVAAPSPAPVAETALLIEIRDLLIRIEARMPPRGG